VATFRSDDSYIDGRRPQKVVFTDARHDALRRDFTINGMFYDPVTDEIIDYVGGRKDLDNGIIRAIGKPEERFAEDHLRMLRAVRFAGRFEFKIARSTAQAIRKHAYRLTRISPERITTEVEQILTNPHRVRGVRLARELGLLSVIFKTVSDEQLDMGMKVLAHLPERSSFALALAGLLVQVEAQSANHICRVMRMSNELRKQTTWLIAQRQVLLEAIPMSRGSLKQWLVKPLFETLVLLIRSYLRATGQSEAPLRQLRRQIKELGDEPVAPPRLLKGHDLMKLGVPAGPLLGQLLEELYLAQLENQIKTKNQARTWAQQWLKRHRCE
jgi:tRNA nucleotidyltransferase/poly(A) polymerase